MQRVPVATLAAAGGVLVGLAGCGGAQTMSRETPAPTPARSSASPATTLEVSADPGNRLTFDKRLLRTTAGKVTLIMDNPSQLGHNIALEGHGVHVQGPTVGRYGTSTVTATLKRGRYTYFCSVPGHRRAGMEGTLIVG